MYFNKFPEFLYDFNINGIKKYLLVKDITVNTRVIEQILSNITLYDEYDIREGETPEIIAEKIYGSPQYHWVVMLCNNRYDYINDFPLPQFEFDKHITQKYGYDIPVGDTSLVTTVDLANNTLFLSNHGLITGDAVIYNTNGGTAIGGLVNGKRYFVIRVTDRLIRFASTRTNAENNVVISLTSQGVGNHILSFDNKYNPHHFEDENGNIVNETYQDVYGITKTGFPVSNYEYEERLNESKRRIKLISPSLLSSILKNFNELI